MNRWTSNERLSIINNLLPEHLDIVSKKQLPWHLSLPDGKSLSYMLVESIQNDCRLTVDGYIELASALEHTSILIPAAKSWLADAVYVFDQHRLGQLLADYAQILLRRRWPLQPTEFVRKSAQTWASDDHPVLPIIRQAYGGPKKARHLYYGPSGRPRNLSIDRRAELRRRRV